VTNPAEFQYCQPLISTSERRRNASLIQDARGDIDYDEEGSGPTILFVPGSWGTRSAWRGVIAALNGQFRIVMAAVRLDVDSSPPFSSCLALLGSGHLSEPLG
jgi:pimeloyl-ACP methyl ester carboxylesterase